MLQDICNTNSSFGGITVIFGGDFQQMLPVVIKGTREDIVQATLQRSHLWNNIQIIHLRQNMQLHGNNSHAFAQWLLDLGHGRTTHEENMSTSITVPEFMCRRSENKLIQSVYGSITNYTTMPTPNFFEDRAILAARNVDVRSLNSTILARLPGDEHMYCSADSYSIESPDQQQNLDVPVEFLHTLNASGLPIAHLRIKIGCPVIILRNIDSKRGLCNGTRATILNITNRLLEIRLIGGDHAGEIALLPRISLSPSITGMDFAIKLNRRQFPIQLALALTVNKSQGQTIKHVGVDLRKPVFSHGQLYVAFSHATSSEHINVLLSPDLHTYKTVNVVYNEILLD